MRSVTIIEPSLPVDLLSRSIRVSPALIPHEDFHKGIWLKSVKRPIWHYFAATSETNNSLCPEFPGSIDEPIRDLVQFLQSRGVKTTPSCAGHYYGKDRFSRIYSALVKDCREIRTTGLEFRDIESGRTYYCIDTDYCLPWNRETFIRDLESYQRKGVVGIRLKGQPGLPDRLANLRFRGVRVVINQDVILFISEWPREENIQAWKRFSDKIYRCLDGYRPAKVETF